MGKEIVGLESLAKQINAKHETCIGNMKNAVLGAIEVGRLLCEAKARVKASTKGRWMAWVEVNCPFGSDQARNYMNAYENRDKIPTAVGFSGSLKGCLRLIDGSVQDDDDDDDEEEAAEGAESEPRERTWRIEQGDCLDLLEEIEDESVRLIFADPPYNIGIEYGDHYDDSRPADEFDGWAQLWLAECFRKLTDDGSLWLLVNHEWARTLCFRAEDLGYHLRQWITWYESFGVNTTKMFNRCSRPLLWLVKDAGNFVFDEWTDQIRRKSDRQEVYNDRRANAGGKLWDDVWGINPPIPRVAGTHGERIDGFPTQLPLALLRPIVACASAPDDLVLDPFSGSGTTGVACIELGRRFIGMELSEEFADLSRARLTGMEAEHVVS